MTSSKLLSFFELTPKSRTIEYLTDHSFRVVKHLRSIGGSRLSRYAVIKGGVSECEFINALVTAGALHDVGKAFYQLNIRDYGEGVRRLSFRGHEWISAYFVHRVWKLIRPGSTALERLMDVVLYAVLLHHHAMDVRGRARELADAVRPPSRNDIVDGLRELSGLISDPVVRDAYLSTLERSVDDVLRCSREGLADLISEVFIAYRGMFKDHLGIRGRRVLYLLATSALVAADYLAAAEVRGESRSRFFKVVKKFDELYLTPSRCAGVAIE